MLSQAMFLTLCQSNVLDNENRFVSLSTLYFLSLGEPTEYSLMMLRTVFTNKLLCVIVSLIL